MAACAGVFLSNNTRRKGAKRGQWGGMEDWLSRERKVMHQLERQGTQHALCWENSSLWSGGGGRGGVGGRGGEGGDGGREDAREQERRGVRRERTKLRTFRCSTLKRSNTVYFLYPMGALALLLHTVRTVPHTKPSQAAPTAYSVHCGNHVKNRPILNVDKGLCSYAIANRARDLILLFRLPRDLADSWFS